MEFYFNKIARLQSTAHYQTKNFVTGTFQEVLKKERMFRNFKNSKKIFAKYLFFSNVAGLQSRLSDFNKNRL